MPPYYPVVSWGVDLGEPPSDAMEKRSQRDNRRTADADIDLHKGIDGTGNLIPRWVS